MTKEVLSVLDISFATRRYLSIDTISAHTRAPSAALLPVVEKRNKPTVKQVYALAAELCDRMGEEFPESRGAASELIERLRIENGHPAPRLEDSPVKMKG